jgi:hypothetical protein
MDGTAGISSLPPINDSNGRDFHNDIVNGDGNDNKNNQWW